MPNNLTYGALGTALTERFEGLKLEAYQDVAGNWTIGYGHKGVGVKEGQTITPAAALVLLEADIRSAEMVVNQCVTYPLNQNQFDALVDLAYNIGVGAFACSTLVRYLNDGEVALAAAEFSEWCHSGGRVVSGLLLRRNAEMSLFETPVAAATARPQN